MAGCSGRSLKIAVRPNCRVHGGDQRERWVGSGLLLAEKQFRRVRGCKHIPALLRVLETLKSPKKEVAPKRKAS